MRAASVTIGIYLQMKSILEELARITGIWGPETWPEWDAVTEETLTQEAGQMEQFGYLDELIGAMLDNAPRQVEAQIKLAMVAINQGNLGEALNKLRQAQKMVDKEPLEGWRAELLAIWGCYHYANGDEKKVRRCIEEAHRLDPNNKRLWQVIEWLKARYRK